jgi:microcystin-dependent protein
VVDGKATWQIRKIGSGGGEAVGVIKAFAGNGDIPSGYLLCDGSAVSRTMFPDLFAAIGTTYGSGDGSTTFNVPDYNTAARFAQGDTVAGVVKQAGLPNITGSFTTAGIGGDNVVYTDAFYYEGSIPSGSASAGSANKRKVSFDASRSSSIYGASTTVQPDALTTRFIIKAFDGQTADSALIDITKYAQELAGKANITGSNLVYHKDVITTSGTYTAPVTGLYRITVKGGGGGGGGGYYSSAFVIGGSGGGEGGITIGFEKLTAGQAASVVIGAGGTGGVAQTGTGGNGGDSSVTVNSNTYTGGGGSGGKSQTYSDGGTGGNGTIPGASGGACIITTSGYCAGNSGGGNGGGSGVYDSVGLPGTLGGGGAGGFANKTKSASYAGGAGGDGYVWFEYMAPV